MSDLRPTEPVLLRVRIDPHMPRTHTQIDPYTASCNPPRQAKRLRSHPVQTDADQSPFSASPPFKAPLISKSPPKTVHTQPGSSSSGPMKATPDCPSSKRRGRKPSTSSRATREAQRKMNHSIIEKARRTKINDALSTLRTLVPLQQKRSQDEDDEDYEVGEKNKKGEDKEFKLDVLVRTVTYLQELTEKVKTLEQGVCSTCDRKMLSKGKKRKKADTEELDIEGPEPACHKENDGHTADPSSPTQDEHTSSSRTRLPPIASWLPNTSIDPNGFIRSPSLIPSSTRNDQQLPSPPSSTDFRPLMTTRIPPALTLPSPKTLGPIRVLPSASRPPISPAYPGSTKTSPLLSPLRTAEDESAASVLLHISSSSFSSTSSGSERSYAGDRDLAERWELREPVEPLTPSSMLGLGKRR